MCVGVGGASLFVSVSSSFNLWKKLFLSPEYCVEDAVKWLAECEASVVMEAAVIHLRAPMLRLVVLLHYTFFSSVLFVFHFKC